MFKFGKVILFFVLLFAYSKWGPAINIKTVTQPAGQPFMVNGTGKVSVTPDIAKVNLGIEENGTVLKLVQDSVNKKSKNLIARLKSLGISDKDIKTTSYYVYPNYDYQNGGQKINGYRVSTSYEVTIKDFDKVNDVLTVGPEVGANIAGGVNFEINDETKKDKLNEARKIAVDEAKEKAKGLANASGITLGKIINISEDMGGSVIRQYALPMAGIGGGIADSKIAQPEIQAGQTDISVSVTLSYEIR
jgi:uncharacterized protein YggE